MQAILPQIFAVADAGTGGVEIGLPQILVIILYLIAISYLGWLGYRKTKTASDYLIAGRQINPFVMAMSYGATFISTSAIVGFGGVAGLFGMSLLWLTFLNIFVGIFIAFVFLGGPTRRMGHHLDAHTFPELIGRRYQSKFVQVFAGLIIFLFIPLYSAAVLIGGCEFIALHFGVDYKIALLVFSVIVAAYVVVGGLKGVMYTDALQGSIMFIGMVILLVATYVKLGGVTHAHQTLTNLASFGAGGHGWTTMPAFGFGDNKYNLWWIVVSTITLGVGIGVLAQPQLAVRFMTVRSKKQLNRAVLVGGIFILVMTGTAFVVGSLSNAYFLTSPDAPLVQGHVVNMVDQDKNEAMLQLTQKEEGKWVDIVDKKQEKLQPVKVILAGAPLKDQLIGDGPDAQPIVQGHATSMVLAKFNPDKIIPTYLASAMPKWFGLIFLLTLLAAAMSTLSSQFHTLGTSIGRDVFEQLVPKSKSGNINSIMITRIGIVVGIILAVIIGYTSRGGYIVARATAIFFGLCGSAFLPAFVGGLFSRKITRAGAISSMIVGFVVTAIWLLLFKAKEAGSIGLVHWFTDKDSLLAGHPNWPVVDPLVIALPLSVLAIIIVSMLTQKPSDDHLEKCFGKQK